MVHTITVNTVKWSGVKAPITFTVHSKHQLRRQQLQQRMPVKRTTDFLNGSFGPMRSTSLPWNRLLNTTIMTGQKHVESEGSAFLRNCLVSSSLGLSHQTPCIFGSRMSFLSRFSIIKGVGSSRLMFSSEIILNILTNRTRGKWRKLIMRMEGNHSRNLPQVKMTLRTLPAESIY